MASISKFSTALLSVPNEVTVAAANFNLNFSLMKVEAPPEFHGLRDALSHRRRHEAEEGLPHVTARCLGALFESVIPTTPFLITAYGKRASEISESTKAAQPHAGMFADRAGADGTSIWAAATSGQHAIAMHLLACMLARIWKPTEATSIWVELVERRKQEIFKAYNASTATGIPSIMAAQQLFTREQLSAWDASARSWLQTADAAKRLEQTQLMLIINNVRMPVNTSQEPYDSVLSAWTSGMNAMERLICGTPQRVQDGAVLLAISAWHLYPNMQVLSDRTKDVDSADELMARSTLTISSYGIMDTKEGVYWSLPLSRMRYYSPPVVSVRSLASDTSRITMEEFQIVVLGAFVGQWKRVCSNEERCCKLIVRLSDAYNKNDENIRENKVDKIDEGNKYEERTPPWYRILAEAASRVVTSKGHLQAQHRKLLRLGSRRCDAFLHDPEYVSPAMFGLEYFHILVKQVRDPEERIAILRRAAAIRMKGSPGLLLRYKKTHAKSGTRHQYASVFPTARSSHKRRVGEHPRVSMSHSRFAMSRCIESTVTCAGGCDCGPSPQTACLCVENGFRCTLNCHPDLNMCCAPDPPPLLDCHATWPGENQASCSDLSPCIGCSNRQRLVELSQEGEEASLIHPYSLDEIDELQFRLRRPGHTGMTTYGLWLGHGSLAAIFLDKKVETYDSYNGNVTDMPTATMDEIEAAVSSKSFNPFQIDLGTCCDHWLGEGYRQLMTSMDALMFASDIYASMPGSAVSIEVINSPMFKATWARQVTESLVDPKLEQGMWWHRDDEFVEEPIPDQYSDLELASDGSEVSILGNTESSLTPNDSSSQVSGHEGTVGDMWTDSRDGSPSWQQNEAQVHTMETVLDFKHSLQRAFACIAWFDSGEFNIPLTNLNTVMALVNGDSIFVASGLVVDPSSSTNKAPIRRVFGNLGRSEMSLLVPPNDPRLAKPELSSWKLINHALFDGQFQDCFVGTSLHLTFTDSEDTVYMGNRGLRDRQVVLLEALVSIEDRGRSVGDLDILSMFSNTQVKILHPCSHSEMERKTFDQANDLIALDCWEEFLDPPESTAIVRSSGNWQARLAAAAAAAQLGKRVVVLPEKPCLQCLVRGTPSPTDCDIIIA